MTDKKVLTQKYEIGEMVHVTYDTGDTGIGAVLQFQTVYDPYPGEYQISVSGRIGVFRDDQIRNLTKLERALS